MQVTVPSHVPGHLVRTESWYGLQDSNGDPNAALMPFFRRPTGHLYRRQSAQSLWHLAADTAGRHSNRLYRYGTFSPAIIFSGMRHLGIEELLIPIEIDPPDHAKYRAFLAPHFSQTAPRGA